MIPNRKYQNSIHTKSLILMHITLLFLLLTLCVCVFFSSSVLIIITRFKHFWHMHKIITNRFRMCTTLKKMMCVYSDFRCKVFLRRYCNTFSIILNAIKVLKMPSELFSNYAECQTIKFILSIYPFHSANIIYKMPYVTNNKSDQKTETTRENRIWNISSFVPSIGFWSICMPHASEHKSNSEEGL